MVSPANPLESGTREGDSPVVGKTRDVWRWLLSTTRHEKACGKLGGPPSKANYLERPIVHKYREGKVKSIPLREMKETLKPCPDKLSEAWEVFHLHKTG